jgi:asparagine synthase (glutamine-hydrolysing)
MSSIHGIVSKTHSAPDADHLAVMHAVRPDPLSRSLIESAHHDSRGSLILRHPRRPLLTNESRTMTLACIGAIPNYRDWREELISLGHTFTTPYDAEPLVHLYEEHGTELFSFIKGPFCLALWDASAQRLILATDPMAQKPLYIYEDNQRIIFASTIPPLTAHPSVPCQSALNNTLLAEALHTGQLPASVTGLKDIHMLGAGEQFIWERGKSTTKCYWQIPAFAPAEPEATIVDHEDRLREKLAESVRLHLAEESVGVLLSGGISSSLVAAMMQQQNRTLRTFTIRFHEKDTPEIKRAAEVAKHLEAKHTLIPIKPPDLSRFVERLVWETASPLLSPHDLLMGILSEAIQSQVDVVLTGTGGVPLLGNPIPEIKPRPRFRRMWQAASTILQRTRAARQREEARAADALSLFSPDEIEALIGVRPDVVLAPASPLDRTATVIASHLTQHLAPIHHVSSAYGIEAQVPFADSQMVEAAALVPLNLKQRPGQPLYVLQESARGLLPSALLKVPVAPEHMPLDRWLRDQKDFVHDILLSDKARARNIVDKQAVYPLIESHMSQRHDASACLLALLSLEIWHRLFIDESHRG